MANLKDEIAKPQRHKWEEKGKEEKHVEDSKFIPGFDIYKSLFI